MLGSMHARMLSFLLVALGGLSSACDDATTLKQAKVLAETDGVIRDIALSDTHVYWTNAGGDEVVLRVSRDADSGSGSVDPLADNDGSPFAIALSGTDLYFTTSGGPEGDALWRLGLEGGDEVLTASANGAIVALAADDGGVIYATNAGAIYAASGDPTSPTKIVDERGPIASLATTPQFLFFTDGASGEVIRITRDGGKPLVLADGLLQPRGLAISDSAVFVAVGASDEGVGGEILKIDLAGGNITQLASEQAISGSGDLVLHDGRLYWFHLDGNTTSVNRVSTGGGSVQEVAREQGTGAFGLAIDRRGLFWAVVDGPKSRILEVQL